MCKCDVIHKTGSAQRITTPREEDRVTAIESMHKKLVKIGRVVPEIWSRTSTHADRQTDTLIRILRAPLASNECLHDKLAIRIQCLLCISHNASRYSLRGNGHFPPGHFPRSTILFWLQFWTMRAFPFAAICRPTFARRQMLIIPLFTKHYLYTNANSFHFWILFFFSNCNTSLVALNGMTLITSKTLLKFIKRQPL